MINYARDQEINSNARIVQGLKGDRKHIYHTYTPNTIDADRDLYVHVPKLEGHDVILKGSLKLVFDFEINSTSKKAYPVNNLSRALITKKIVRIGDEEVLSISNANIWYLYKDQWMSRRDQRKRIRQGFGIKFNKLRGGDVKDSDKTAGDEEKAVQLAYGKRFEVPLDFELFDDFPFYPSGMENNLTFILTFAPYKDVIIDPGVTTGPEKRPPDATYSITNIGLEYDIVESPSLSHELASMYTYKSIPYNRVLQHTVRAVAKNSNLWNINVNVPSKSLNALALIFIDPDNRKPYEVQEHFYNPNIEKISIDINGKPNQLYSHGFQSHHAFENAVNFFVEDSLDVEPHQFLVNKYCVLLNFKSTMVDRQIHGAGLSLGGGSGIDLHIYRKADSATGNYMCYAFVIQDAFLNLEGKRLNSIVY